MVDLEQFRETLTAEDLSDLYRLRAALPSGGLGGWRGVEVLDRLLSIIDSAKTEQPGVPDEAARLLAICQNAHDRLLRGDDDSELLAILEQAWSARRALGAGNG